ncbi:hypothetical protein LXA43DRAFT_244168 [Ganoderma leucocontextum]|nr:hypothetical protein LXA43DRAFT_244168 [Ganoderma leucocontextum]
MNSSTFSPTQFAGAAYFYPSTTTFHEDIASSYASPSYPNVFVDPQWSTWSQTQAIPFGWSDPDSEPSSVSHVERCENFLPGELAYPNALPYELFDPAPSSDVSILPDVGCALASNSSDSPFAHSPPYGSECVLSVQYDAHNPPMPQPAPVPPAYSLARVVIAAPSIASALFETFVHPEHDSGQADEEIDISTHAVPQDTQPSHRAYSRASSHSSSSYHSSSPEPYPQPSSELIACRRRNAPAPRSTAISANRWKCPHCTHVQRNRRSPDLKRHIETHTRGADVADWVCCGVPVDNAVELGIPAAVLRAAPVFDFEGVLMIGGCRKTFSRRDALKRHLKARNETCYGDPLGLYQPRNRELEDRA